MRKPKLITAGQSMHDTADLESPSKVEENNVGFGR